MVMGDVVMEPLKAPFPWFGGKRLVAPIVWKRFGSVVNYVEPFFGSGACLLGRPVPFDGPETINDLDGYVANFWRAVQADPEAVARWSHQPKCRVSTQHSLYDAVGLRCHRLCG